MLTCWQQQLKNCFKRIKTFQRKKNLSWEFWKLGAVYFLYSKNFFPVFKNKERVVEDNQTTFFFFFFRPNKHKSLGECDKKKLLPFFNF